MKVTLVVAAGAHQGKTISIVGGQFLIGRDPECQLRPASQAISKKHAGILIRDGKVYVRDYGSTNGTLVNDTLLQDEELAVANNDSLKIGPLDFTLRIEPTVAGPDGTPLPDKNPEASAAMAAIKATAGTATKTPSRDNTPNPARPKQADSKPAIKLSASAGGETEQDKIAAMLLGMDEDDSSPDIPQGSTVMDAPALDAMGQPIKQPEKKDDGKKPAQTREEMSSAASEILRKYMRRPK
ncbi:MAG TPA: FHA domain-containing protein [Gemmataceae bacterium]|nr:FHA domain-containing protein [Gemmataceae bacterium]